MKKILFYNPASPLFFHIAVVLFFVLLLLLFSLLSLLSIDSLPFFHSLPFSLFYTPTFFSVLYPFFALAMATITRKAYINTYQAPIPEEFVNKLALYNRYLITAIYLFSYTTSWVTGVLFLSNRGDDVGMVFAIWFAISLLISVPYFLFHLFILPASIRFVLLNKMCSIDWAITIGIFFLLFLPSLYFLLILL